MKISIVTPSSNSARHIGETIRSVMTQQGEFSIEYIIVDNCSTDGTEAIVAEFQKIQADGESPLRRENFELHYISEPDEGMYDAINKGFSRATGDIFAWINADDIYLPGAFAAIIRVFSEYEDVHWVKGITSYINERDIIWKAGRCFLYGQSMIRSGVYGRDSDFIQQDSVFWRSWMWGKSGGIDADFKLAGDYYLWTRFAELAPLVSVRVWVSCFRKVKGQLSEDSTAYMREVRAFSPAGQVAASRLKLLRMGRKLPFFLGVYLYRLAYWSESFSIVLINPDESICKVDGKYHEVVAVA